jgi:hypothetical protein
MHDMASGTPRAYTNAIVSVGNSSRAVVRFTCVSCSHELELANNDPGRKHGAFFGSQARKRGWDTDGSAINRVYCPDCRKTPAFRTRREIELDGVVLPALEASEPPIIEGHVEPMPTPREDYEKGLQRLPPSREITMPRELTQAQRMQIRSLLDKHFDDKEGCYLVSDDGAPMSDQAIGSMVGVPWGEVTKIREAAYGKILVDPAIAALRAQMDELHRVVAEQLAILERRMGEMRLALDGYGRQQQAKVG